MEDTGELTGISSLGGDAGYAGGLGQKYPEIKLVKPGAHQHHGPARFGNHLLCSSG